MYGNQRECDIGESRGRVGASLDFKKSGMANGWLWWTRVVRIFDRYWYDSCRLRTDTVYTDF